MVQSKIFPLLALLFLLSWATNASAQRPIKIGVRGGINFASGSVTNFPAGSDISSRTAFGLGGVAEIGLSDVIYLQAEPRYIQKGGKIAYSLPISGIAKFNYFEIPISVKAQFGTSALKPYIFAGPTLSFLLMAESESEFQGQISNNDIKNETASTELSLDIGAGVACEIAPTTSITADIRYTLGMTQIAKPSAPNDKSTWNSRDVKLFVGVLFTL